MALGVPPEKVTFGHVISQECDRLGIDLELYLEEYDITAAQPFDGVVELVAALERWAVCSNKHPRSGRAELQRLAWEPDVALFADAFDGPKSLPPVLDALGLEPTDVVFIGDTAHDRAAASAAGVPFGIATWNPRATVEPGDVVLRTPADVLRFVQSG